MSGFSAWAEDKRLKGLVILVLMLAAVSLVAYSYSTYKQSQYTVTGPTTITAVGKGEIFAKPDIATFSFAVEAEAVDAAQAQEKSALAMNAIVEHLKTAGVEDKDVKTSGYALNPKYRYEQGVCTQWGCPNGKQILEGYTVNQTVTVKVRDTAKAGDLISSVGTKGATNISGLSFTIDDDEKLKRDARELAIKDAKENAQKLADDLDVSIIRMMSYFEETNGGYPIPMYDMAMSARAENAMGGDMKMTAPSIPSGENTITSNVSIVYEIK
ncbi:MAG: hypothetical protein RLZZ234_335 [Candidatus Parcubacteria bacterium]|jgi:uncharacterized protein YggE